VKIHSLGLPRVGAHRELKFALEAYWAGETDQVALHNVARALRFENWQKQNEVGQAWVTVNDFSLYDHVLDHSVLLGVVPSRFNDGTNDLDNYFRMARGKSQEGESKRACEMKKWFDTNYHYIVPELSAEQTFTLNPEKLLKEITEAKAAGYSVKPTILGPVTYLWLARCADQEFEKLTLLPPLLNAYERLLSVLAAEGVEWVQVDEPILVLEIDASWKAALEQSYQTLSTDSIRILLSTYFGDVAGNQSLLLRLPVQGIHLDAVRGGLEYKEIINQLDDKQVLSLGIVDGRNIWKTDLAQVIKKIAEVNDVLGARLWLATSCSLLHVPVDLDLENELDGELKNWLAFANQKLVELSVLKSFFEGHNCEAALASNALALANRRSSSRVHKIEVTARCNRLSLKDGERHSAYPVRAVAQKQALNLPLFPTTTIGSFPQTQEIRQQRLQYRKGDLSQEAYDQAMKAAITYAVQEQENVGLDMLVHGEPERNDMVEYFGELLEGYAASRFGWVQSYGSRCVKPPIIYGDVERLKPMTVEWAEFAQSLTVKPMKGMLTGPVTMQQWAFVRDDLSRSKVALQIALALRDEVSDLEAAGISAIQIDEPAIREGLPLKRSAWDEYLSWAVYAFRVSASAVEDKTQIHTHMCYSEFHDIVDSIIALDADVITIETARSEMALLDAFVEHAYPNEMGPGVYDIHSPNVPESGEMVRLLLKALRYIPAERLWINPDCGLKTRQWPQVKESLEAMVEAAHIVRTKQSTAVA